jgi:hypothetical protein
MQQPSVPRPLPRPIGGSGAAAVLAGAAMGAPVGLRVACHLSSWVTGPGGCVPGGAPAGAVAGAVLALVVLPLLGQGTRRGEHAAHRPAPTTTTAARLVWLAVAAALGRWLAQAVLHPQMELEGVLWLALLPVVLVAAAGLAMVAQGLVRRRGWARWAAVVACSLAGVAALVGVVDWARRWCARGPTGGSGGPRRSTWPLRCCSWPSVSRSSCCSWPQPPAGTSGPAGSHPGQPERGLVRSRLSSSGGHDGWSTWPTARCRGAGGGGGRPGRWPPGTGPAPSGP